MKIRSQNINLPLCEPRKWDEICAMDAVLVHLLSCGSMASLWSAFRRRGSLCSLGIVTLLAVLSDAWTLFGRERRRRSRAPDGGAGPTVRTSKLLLSERFGRTLYTSIPSVSAPSNETEIHHRVDSFFREGADALSSVAAHPKKPSSSSSLERAAEQVNALFDLCSESRRDELAYVSSDVALDALEGFVSRVLKDVEHCDDSSSCWTDCQAEALEKLMDRVNDVGESPSLRTVENLWMIQQYKWERILQTNEASSPTAAQEHVDRTVRLLQSWMDWAEQPLTLLEGHPPPTLFLLKALQTASRYRVEMSEGLWKLYVRTVQLNAKNRQRVCREVHTYLLDILSYSGTEWETRQCHVLRNAVTAVPGAVDIDDDDDDDQLSLSEWFRALKSSCRQGRVTEAAWLARIMMNKHRLNTTDTSTVHLLFLESLLTLQRARFVALHGTSADGLGQGRRRRR